MSNIFYSVFESWYIKEHSDVLRLPQEWVARTFETATFFNGLSAILAGIVANTVSETLGYGPVAPFLVGVGCFMTCFLIVFLTWSENYGDTETNLIEAYKNGFRYIVSNKALLLLGSMQSIVEACMYIFVFLWTPVLSQPQGSQIPLGLVFSAFMICIMIVFYQNVV